VNSQYGIIFKAHRYIHKELSPNRDISGQDLPGPSMITPSGDTGMTMSGPNPSADIPRTIVEQTE